MLDETEWPKEKPEEYDSLLSTLTEPERRACDVIAIVGPEEFGLTSDILTGLKVEDEALNSLVEKDLLESKPVWEFHEEFLNKYKEAIEFIKNKKTSRINDPNGSNCLCPYSDRWWLNTCRISQSIVDDQSSTPSYRLKDSGLRKYLKKLSQQEEENN